MNRNRRIQPLLVACALCLSAPVATAGDWSSAIKLERVRLSLTGATTIGTLESRPDAAKRNFTERSFDLSSAQAHSSRWMLDFTIRSGDAGEPARAAASARAAELVGFAASTPPVGEPRGNELLLRARYDF